MASIKQRPNGMWRAQLCVLGQRASADFTVKADAKEWAAKEETAMRAAAKSGIVVGKTVQNLFDKYLAEVSTDKKGNRWEKVRLHKLARDDVGGVNFGEMLLADVTPEFISGWRDMRLKVDKVKGATVIRDMNLLSHAFTMAKDSWKWIATNPTSAVTRPKDSPPRDRLISADESERICLALGFDGTPTRTKNAALAVAFLFAIETGMRVGEICALRRAWISGAVAHLPANVVKNGVKRDVPLSKRALELLALLPAGDTVFGITAASADSLFRKARLRAMVDDLHFHDTRHEAITRLAKRLKILDLARMVGHRDIRQLQVYYNETAGNIALLLD